MRGFLLLLLSVSMLHAQPNLEEVATFDLETPPGNIAVSSAGRIFISLHAFFRPKYRLMEVLPNGETKPFPTKKWSLPPKPLSQVGLHDVLGLNCDGQGRLWLLDGGERGVPGGKLVAWNLAGNNLDRIIYIPSDVLTRDPFLNDLAIDTLNGKIYIADTARPFESAIIVVDIKTGASRRVLHGHRFLAPEDKDMVIDGRRIMMGPHPARVGINPITIDHHREYIYFGAMSGTKMYRLATSILKSDNLSDSEIISHITTVGERPFSDGISIDDAGNIYITAITKNEIGVLKPGGTYQSLIQDDEKLSWPDSIAAGPDGYMYVVVNELHNSPPLNQGKMDYQGTFAIYKFRPLANVTVGR